jgi:hypothetical protein
MPCSRSHSLQTRSLLNGSWAWSTFIRGSCQHKIFSYFVSFCYVKFWLFRRISVPEEKKKWNRIYWAPNYSKSSSAGFRTLPNYVIQGTIIVDCRMSSCTCVHVSKCSCVSGFMCRGIQMSIGHVCCIVNPVQLFPVRKCSVLSLGRPQRILHLHDIFNIVFFRLKYPTWLVLWCMF